MNITRIALSVLIGISLHANCKANDSFPEAFSDKPTSRITASENPFFKNPIYAIQNVISYQHKNRNTNHFCVIGYTFSSRTPIVWVHWQEEKLIMQWRGNSYRDMRDKGLIQAQHSLKLGRDTVATEDEIHGSTYLVTTDWWHAVVNDCAEHGEKFTIRPFKATKPYAGAEQ